MNLTEQVIFILIIFSCLFSCKSTKNIDKGATSIDSVEVMRVDTVIVHKTDSIGIIKYDSGSSQIDVIDFNYDSTIKKPYVSRITVFKKKNDKGESIIKVEKLDSTSANKKDSTKLIEATKHLKKQVERKGLSWWNWLLLIPLTAIIILLIKYWKKIKLLFNVLP